MAWFNLVEMNMNISRNVYEGKSNYYLISLIQKIATYTIIPLALIAIFEAIVKNFILINLTNFSFVLLNRIYDAFIPAEKKGEDPEAVPTIPVQTVVEPPPTVIAPPVETGPPVIIEANPKKGEESLFDGVSTAAKVGVYAMAIYFTGATLYSLYATGCTSIVISSLTLPICPDTWPMKLIGWFR